MRRLQPTASMSSGSTFASINERYTYNTAVQRAAARHTPSQYSLKDKGHLGLTELSSKKVVVHLAELRIREVVPAVQTAIVSSGVNPMHLPRADPPASISIEQRWRLDQLLPILASLAFKRIVRIRNCSLIEFEELS